MFKKLAVATLAMMSTTEANSIFMEGELQNMLSIHVERDDVEDVQRKVEGIERRMRYYRPERDLAIKMERHVVRFTKTDEVRKITELLREIDHAGPRYFTSDEEKLIRLTEFQMRVLDMSMMGLEHGTDVKVNKEHTAADMDVPDAYWWYFNEQYAIEKELEKKIYQMEVVRDLKEMTIAALKTKEFKRIVADWKEQTQTEDHQEILDMLKKTVEAALKVPDFGEDSELVNNAQPVKDALKAIQIGFAALEGDLEPLIKTILSGDLN